MTVDKGIFIKNIYYMLSYAFQILKQGGYEKVASEQFDEVHDLFAEILAKGIAKQLKQGLYREYIPIQENLSVMRGKLNVNDTINLKIQRKQQLACEFDEFSENNIYNRILKTTITCLIGTDKVNTKRKIVLKKLLMFFGNVDLIQPDHILWEKLVYQRSNYNYELLLNICFFVLNGMLQTTEKGEYKLLSFTDEHMERLYEKFILEYYKRHRSDLNPKSTKIDWDLTGNLNPSVKYFLPIMQTDITLQKNGKTLIIDAKYYGKVLKGKYKAKLQSANLYQIYAYVKNMDKNNTGNVSGLLLYAKTEEVFSDEGLTFLVGGNSIGAETLDLNQDFTSIEKQLNRIADDYFGKFMNK